MSKYSQPKSMKSKLQMLTFLVICFTVFSSVLAGGKGNGSGGSGSGGASGPTYTWSWLGTLGGDHSTAVGINANGDIYGNSTTASGELHPFVIPADGSSDGAMIDFQQELVDLGLISTYDPNTQTGVERMIIYDMNSAGEIVGESREWTSGVSSIHLYHFVPAALDASGEPLPPRVDILDTTDGNNIDCAHINEAGTVVSYTPVTGIGNLPYVWSVTSGYNYLNLPFNFNAFPTAINSSGAVCGRSGSIDGAWKYIPGSGFSSIFSTGPYRSDAMDINDSGQIAGNYQSKFSSYQYAFRANPDGTILTIKMPKSNPSSANGINSAGDVLGRGYLNGGMRPFLYTDSSGIVDLLGQTTNLPQGISFQYVHTYDINDAGQIVGYVLTFTETGNSNNAFLLTPNP